MKNKQYNLLVNHHSIFKVLFCMGIGCIVYPSGWDDEKVKHVCGQDTGKYKRGLCEIRWAYILSIVLIFDAFILAVLAFFLAAKQADLLPKQEKEKQKCKF
jgi:hypothetical protein